MKKATPNAPKHKEPRTPQSVWPVAQSLKPGPEVVMAAAAGLPYATEIARAWRCQHTVKVLSRDEYERLIERCGSVTF